MTYKEKLLDPRWQKKRLEILQRDDFMCKYCGDKKSQLQIHHKEYIKFIDPWEYPDELLITLCLNCHETHKTKEEDIDTIRLRYKLKLQGFDKEYIEKRIKEYI